MMVNKTKKWNLPAYVSIVCLMGFINDKSWQNKLANFILIHKSSLFSVGWGFPGSKQLAVLLRTENGGCFGDPAEGAEGA